MLNDKRDGKLQRHDQLKALISAKRKSSSCNGAIEFVITAWPWKWIHAIFLTSIHVSEETGLDAKYLNGF